MEPLMFGVDVEVPVRGEVAVAGDCAEDEEGFGARDAPPAAGDVESVGDEMTGGAFDDATGDRPAGGEGSVVVDEVGVVREVVAGLVDARALVLRQPASVGLRAHLAGGLGGASGQ